MNTRHSSNIFGLGNKINSDDSKIKGSKLPTNLQVLRCMMYHIEEGLHENRTKWKSSKLVLSQLKEFYGKANIPIISERKACEKIIKLIDENAKLRAIPLNRRSTPNVKSKVKQMEDKLSLIFPLWPVNVEQQMKNQEDLSFLQSMKTDRMAAFGSYDKSLKEKIKRKEHLLQQQERRKVKEELNSSIAKNNVFSSTTSDEESIGDNFDFEGPSTSNQSQHRNKKKAQVTEVIIELKKKELICLYHTT